MDTRITALTAATPAGRPAPAARGQEEVAAPRETYVASAAPPAHRPHGAAMCECCGSAAAGALQGGHLGPAMPALVATGKGLSMDPQSVTHVLYHEDCYDGFGAAYAAWKALGDRATYLPVKYGQPVPDLPRDARVAIVDFSFPRQQLLELKDKVEDLVVLDHHKTAQENLQGLEFARFDMNRAGAGLSWEFFHPGEAEPALLQYVEDRDLWKFELPQSREVSTALASYDMDFQKWDSLTVDQLRQEGVPLTRYRDQLVEMGAERAGLADIGGYRVPVVNAAAELRSEMGNKLLEKFPEAPFAGVWFIDEHGKQAFSLRSRGDFDVSQVAKQFGGGGHKAAAAFARKPGEWFQVP